MAVVTVASLTATTGAAGAALGPTAGMDRAGTAGAGPVSAVGGRANALARITWRTDLCSADALRAGGDLRTRSPGARVECARVVVPMDWARPAAGTISLLVTRVPRRVEPGDTRPTRVMFVNPGGPGSAAAWMAPGVAFAQRQVHRTSDIVAVDPRGTGGSTPLACLMLDDGVRDYRTPTAREIALQQEAARREVQGCVAQNARYLRNIGTGAMVRDLDHVRSLMGADTIDYYGVSAGTWLGAHYAQAYPRRVGRFVLDGNTQFTSDWRRSFAWQPRGFERRFRQQFLPWLARHHRVYRLGSTAAATAAAYERLRARVAAGDLDAFSPNDLDSVVVEGLYFDVNFPDLAELLSALTRTIAPGRAVGADGGVSARAARAAVAAFRQHLLGEAAAGVGDGGVAGRGLGEGASPRSYRSAASTVFMAVQCNDDVWDRRPSTYRREGIALGARYPLLGYTWVTSSCAYWPYRVSPLPRPTGRGVPPMLMVQSELDAATPWEGASLADRSHASTRLLTVDDSGNHGSFMTGNRCVESAVNSWLVGGRLPAPGATCRGLPLPGDPKVYPYRLRPVTARPNAGRGTAAAIAAEPRPGVTERVAERRFRQRLLAAQR